jgi:hypothetical protein
LSNDYYEQQRAFWKRKRKAIERLERDKEE